MSKITYEEAIEQGLTKQCTCCKEVKTIDKFDRNKQCKMGANSKCKRCKSLTRNIRVFNSVYDKTLFKTCVDCNTSKSVEEFNKDKGGVMGVRAECKDCRAKRRLADPNHRKKERIINARRDKDEDNRKNREKYWNNPEKSRQRVLDYYYANQEERIAYAKQWKENNKDKVDLWRANNADKVSATRNRRRTAVLDRIRDNSCEKFIGIFYYVSINLSRVLDKQFHVDHIIPLQGKNISGFHHQANLQVISATANLRKGNKY